jgi:hypothetical protein
VRQRNIESNPDNAMCDSLQETEDCTIACTSAPTPLATTLGEPAPTASAALSFLRRVRLTLDRDFDTWQWAPFADELAAYLQTDATRLREFAPAERGSVIASVEHSEETTPERAALLDERWLKIASGLGPESLRVRVVNASVSETSAPFASTNAGLAVIIGCTLVGVCLFVVGLGCLILVVLKRNAPSETEMPSRFDFGTDSPVLGVAAAARDVSLVARGEQPPRRRRRRHRHRSSRRLDHVAATAPEEAPPAVIVVDEQAATSTPAP